MLISLSIILLLLFSGCNQTQDTNPNEPSKVSFESLSLLKTEHPELDFGISQHDGQKTIRDFAIMEDENLLLLELSGKVYECSPMGELLESYDFGFDEKGLTAYMLTCDNQGNFYFVDGHNCLITKADKNGILNTASFGEKSIITEPGLIKSISASEENILIIEAISPDDYLTYTYELDVSEDNAISTTGPQVGIPLGNGLSYKNELIRNEDGGLTDGISVTIYKNGIEKNKFEVHTTNNFIAGLRIYGVTQSGGYFARIYEFLADGNTPQETLVTIDEQGKVKSIYEGSFKSDDIIRGYNDSIFVLRFDSDGIIVFPVLDLFSTSKEESWFQ
ncbi:hypothetical protein K8M07_10970 [Schnuerera sp. xch1]|uniref:hypothetical protein n=1 Tax=Schnuerera sp. xch1 TaxID=2874283 RepID=UPI001CBF153A|nr:hypothetical protein [Schnuerera sp. xch1]MBZ2175758.1 hypothetical protein [Schnuerera sp. xch1]